MRGSRDGEEVDLGMRWTDERCTWDTAFVYRAKARDNCIAFRFRLYPPVRPRFSYSGPTYSARVDVLAPDVSLIPLPIRNHHQWGKSPPHT